MSRRTTVAKYVGLRMRRAMFAERCLDRVQFELAAVNTDLKEVGLKLKDPILLDEKVREDYIQSGLHLRRKKEELQVENSRLTTVILSEVPPQENLIKEFQDLCAIPSVDSVRVEGHQVALYIKARLSLEGRIYDLGDWRLAFDLSRDLVRTSQARTGLSKTAQKDGYYKSRQYSWDREFCFGRNLELVEGLVEQGDYVTAARVAVTYLNGVNPEHEALAAVLYREVS